MILICRQGELLDSRDTTVAVNTTIEAAMFDWHRTEHLTARDLFDVYEVQPTGRVVRPEFVVSYVEPIAIVTE